MVQIKRFRSRIGSPWIRKVSSPMRICSSGRSAGSSDTRTSKRMVSETSPIVLGRHGLHPLCWRSRPTEVEAQRALAFPLCRNLAVDLLRVLAPLGDGLRTGFETGFDLDDLGIGVFERIDPVRFRGQPIGGQHARSICLIAGQGQRA